MLQFKHDNLTGGHQDPETAEIISQTAARQDKVSLNQSKG
jgi:hypothetical protein